MKTPVFSLASACAPRRTSPPRPCGRPRRPRAGRRARRSTPSCVPSGQARRHQRVDQLVLGRQHHVGGAEDGVRPGREDPDRLGAGREVDVRAGGPADPVALHQLDRLGPVQGVQVGQQPVAVRGDPHHPLLQVALEDREVAALGAAVGGDLLVGQHGAQARAPVDRRLARRTPAGGRRRSGAARRGQVGPGPAVRGRAACPPRTRRSARRSAGPCARPGRTRS